MLRLMDVGNTPPQQTEQPLFPEPGGEWEVKPLKPQRPSRTIKEIESRLTALQVAMSMDLDLAKREILQAVRNMQASLEAIAREMERKITDSRPEK